MDNTIQHLMKTVEDATDELVELLQALVRLETVNTGAPESGREIEACRLLERRFRQEGIRSTILESAPSRGNILAGVGDGDSPRLMLMSHLDVVPADERRWQRPPFCGDIVGDKVYGRGSDDAKSLVATGAMALILLKRAGVSLQGELRFLGAADEEAGGRFGIAWLADEHPDAVRADWALNEGGGMPVDTTEGLAYLLSLGEKGRMEAQFHFSGESAHGARPWLADNALYKAGRLLERLHAYEPEIDLSFPTFQHLGLFGIEEGPSPDNLDQLLAPLADQDAALSSTLKALSRMTVVPTMAEAGLKSNSIPAAAELTCDIRTLPHQDQGYVRRELERLTAGIGGTRFDLDVTAVANASPLDSPFVDQLRRATALALGDEEVPLIPALTVGFTDSRCVRPLGTEAYGFAPIAPSADRVRSGVHGVDEAMEIENLVLRTKLYVALACLVLGT